MIKLLIVDDEKIIRETLLKHIPWEALGIRVIGTAQNGLEAYDVIMDEYPDIVMTDIKMPGLSGLELLQRIKRLHPEVEFIILSGYGEFEFAREAMQFGVRHYLLKPFKEEMIIQTVREVSEEIARKRISSVPYNPSPLKHLDSTMLLNILNEGVARDILEEEGNFPSIYAPYHKFLDFENTPYELCYLYFVDETILKQIVELIRNFRREYTPGLSFHILYVRQTLLFFFMSYQLEYSGMDHFMEHLKVPGQTVSSQYKRLHYDNLQKLLNDVIRKVKRYEIIYYDNDGALITICNYRSITKNAEYLTQLIYKEELTDAKKALDELMMLFLQITDPVFFRQLSSSVLMYAASVCPFFSALNATELLLKIRALNGTQEMLQVIVPKLHEIFERYHEAGTKSGGISARIDEYVKNNLSDCNLSLKWIAENYLYMNIDYVSKKFVKETGERFSDYLTRLRIQKAKELLSGGGTENDKILSVAEMVGCGNNPKYFSQLFRKAVGMTPSAYIKFISGGNKYDTGKTESKDRSGS